MQLKEEILMHRKVNLNKRFISTFKMSVCQHTDIFYAPNFSISAKMTESTVWHKIGQMRTIILTLKIQLYVNNI